MKKTIPVELNNEELQDLWSALAVWQDELDKKRNPLTAKALKNLTAKVRKHIAELGKSE